MPVPLELHLDHGSERWRSKLIESAQARWRAVNAPQLVALVRTGARFGKGLLVDRVETVAA